MLLSREPLFVGKAALFPGCVFAIGYDTARRLLDPRYYDGEAGRDAALESIRAHGCRLLVAGRVVNDVFYTLDDLAIRPPCAIFLLRCPRTRSASTSHRARFVSGDPRASASISPFVADFSHAGPKSATNHANTFVSRLRVDR